MSIQVVCPQCGTQYTVDDSAAGKLGLCKACGIKMRIPGEAAPSAPPT